MHSSVYVTALVPPAGGLGAPCWRRRHRFGVIKSCSVCHPLLLDGVLGGLNRGRQVRGAWRRLSDCRALFSVRVYVGSHTLGRGEADVAGGVVGAAAAAAPVWWFV